jgi:outer membrane biosynthesis protein TonB
VLLSLLALLLPSVGHAADPTLPAASETLAEEAPPAELPPLIMPVAGIEPPPPPPPPIVMVVSAEPLGSADDRTTKAIESAITSADPELLACWEAASAEGEPELRYLLTELRFRLDGTVRKALVVSSTGREGLDACGVARLTALTIPPPQFPDRVEVAITWADGAELAAREGK